MQLSNEYIRGLVDGEGCFTFYTTKTTRGGKVIKTKIPAFALSMHERDRALIEGVRDSLGISNRVYTFRSPSYGGSVRGNKTVLVVRKFSSLKNVIIPFFYKKLKGNKGLQFLDWLEKIGSDPLVPDSYKLLYRLHTSGYFDDNPKFI